MRYLKEIKVTEPLYAPDVESECVGTEIFPHYRVSDQWPGPPVWGDQAPGALVITSLTRTLGAD